jgi:hypothetical protein
MPLFLKDMNHVHHISKPQSWGSEHIDGPFQEVATNWCGQVYHRSPQSYQVNSRDMYRAERDVWPLEYSNCACPRQKEMKGKQKHVSTLLSAIVACHNYNIICKSEHQLSNITHGIQATKVMFNNDILVRFIRVRENKTWNNFKIIEI